jgi:hypothetical protein
MSDEDFQKQISDWERHSNRELVDTDDIKIRIKLYQAYDLAKYRAKKMQSKRGLLYSQDLMFGIQMSKILKESGFTVRNASSDDIWRYISIMIIPDVVYDRWKDKSDQRKINDERFWETTRRIWLKVLWWYIYLSFRSDFDKTEKILEDNNADEISQLVERAGRTGYRVNLYREIMYNYSLISVDDKIKEKNLLSRILQLNIIWASTIEPELIDGGLQTYVKNLFDYFGYLKEKANETTK